MSSSYSSIIGNIWPPPNQETIDRLHRLKELQELRQSRDSKIQPSSVTSDVGVVSDSSRANRRNLVSSYRLPTSRLRDRQGDSSASTTDRPKYSRGNLETTSLRLNGSRDEIEERTSDFGGAKPKKLGYSRSLTQNDSSGSEILRELRNNTRRETGGFLRRPRERTSSVDSDTSEEQNPIIMKAKSALDENKAKVEFSENQAPDLPADSAEKEVTLNDISTESENIDPHEDIEQFKQSLYGSSSYGALGDTGASKLTPFSFKTSPATRHLDINRIGVSRYSSRESDAVSLTEKPAVRSTYNVSDGFKRIDDLFGGSSTMSKPIEQIKVRSRVKKKESDDTKSDADASADTANVIQSDIRSLHSVTESSEEVPSHRQSESTLITPTENVDITDVILSSVARQDTEILDTPSDESDKPKRVLICDGESMVVADEEGENEILMQSCETSKIDEVDTDHVVMIEPVGSMREVEQIEIDQNSKEYHMNNEIENEHSEDSGHVIIGSVSTADMGNDTGSSILSESDSIFDYNKKYDGIDAYFDSMDKSKNITELHSRHTRRDIPSYSRTKSVPYETTGRTSRYSSLPTSSVDEKLAEFRSRFASRYADPSSETGSSTIEDRLSEIRARYSGRRDETDSSVTSEGRYSSRRIETDSFAPSELRYSSIGSSYDRDRLYSRNVETDGSLSSDSRYSYRSADTDESVLNETRYSSIGNAYDTGLRDRFHSDKVSSIGTDPTSRTDSKLSKIITKSFQSIDNYFSGPKSPEVILRRRTTRKTSDEVVGREESSSDNTMPCNVESGATLRSDITERESNDREDDMQDENDDIISSDQKSMDVSEESDKTVENMNNFLRNDSDRGVDDVTDDVTEKDNDRQDEVIEVEKYEVRPCVVESGNVICLESNMASKQENQEKTANDDDVTPVIDNLQTIELDADTVLVSDKTYNFEVVNNLKKEQTTKDGDTIQSSTVVNQTDSQNSQKSKDKKKDKKKKSKKKKGNAQKDNNSLNDNKDIESALNSENIDKRVDDVENVTSSCESSSSKSFQGTLDSANTSKASSKLAKDTDHNSDRTSIATEDLLSLVSSEGVTQVKHSNDEDKTPTADDASDTSKSRESLSVANADQYATFEGEDIPHSTQKKLDKKEICVDEYSAASTDGDNFETASETTESGEFFEAIPTEVLEGLVIGSNSAVERKEKFVYLCPKSKVRKRKIKMNSLLGTSGIKKQNKSTDRQRLGQVKAWMENNIFPTADDTSQKEVVSLKSVSSNFGSAFSVESVIGDDESKSSTLTLGNTASELSQQTVSSYTVINRCEQKSSAIQTDSVSVRNSSSQTWTKTWNIGVQVDTDQYNISTQTVLDVLCPCCKQTIDLKAALSGIPLENQQELASILPNDISGSVVNTETTENVINLTEKVEPDKQKDDFKSNLSNVTNGSGEKTKSDSSRSHSRTSSAGSSKQTSSDSSRRPSAKPSPSDSPVKVKSVPVSPSKQSANGQPLKTSRKVSPKAEVKKTSVKSRREKVADVKDLLYNTDIGKSPRVSQKPPVHTPAKSKSRENSNDRNKSRQNENKIEKCTKKSAKSNVTKTTKSREPSEDRSSTAGSELQGNTPSYMQSTRSSSRKSVQSRENSQERILNNTEAKSVAAVKEKPKVQRSESYHRARSRGNSEERTENTEISGVPSYMQPTRASTRKKSEGGTPGKEDKSKKPLINKNSHSSNEDENQDHIVSVKDNPFVQNDSSKRKKKQSSDGMSVFERLGNSVKQEQVGKGFWYRKEPIKDTSPKKVKVKSPKKSRSMSWTAIDTVFDKLTGRNAKNRRKDSAENSDTKSLGSRSSLVEIDVDNSSVVIDESQRNGTKLVFDSNEIHNVKPSIPNSNKSHQAGSSSSAAGDDEDHEQTENGSGPSSPREDNCDLSAEEKALAQDRRGAEEEGDDEVVPVRVNLTNWDPTKLLMDLYSVNLMSDNVEDISDKFIIMEGLMEKLPMNKKKATLLKTWKRRFFRAKDGWLHYFETGARDKPSDSLQLMGGRVDDLGNRILGIDDGRGRYLMVRCPTDKEYGQWKLALESQTADNVRATYIRPALQLPKHPDKNVVVIDIGSSAIRAGILGEQATLPQLFFPSTVARNKKTDDLVTGIEAYTPSIRQNSELRKPVYPTDKVDKFGIDIETIASVFKKIFTELNIDSTKYWVMISTPQNLGDKIRTGLMDILIDQFNVKGVSMVMQSLLALYSYNTTSGIIVDIGERMEILPIYDGYVIEGGVSRQSYGGQKVAQSLNYCLGKYKFSTPIQQLLVRYVMEQSCYVSMDYKETLRKCEADPDSYKTMVSLNNYDLPEGADVTVTHDYSCFKSPEGFFNTDLWGMDYPCVHKLVFKAIQSCPMDGRKRMYRAVYLSGGVTLLPGFAERLQHELSKLAPPSVVVEVHAAPNRYHSAFIGACSLANMEQFQTFSITAAEWKKEGAKAFKKWNMS